MATDRRPSKPWRVYGANNLSEADWGTPADAEHIASWQPSVALAVADWLEEEAAHEFAPDPDPALAVARAYLDGAN